jgi:hypothetical protein
MVARLDVAPVASTFVRTHAYTYVYACASSVAFERPNESARTYVEPHATPGFSF